LSQAFPVTYGDPRASVSFKGGIQAATKTSSAVSLI